MRTNAPIFGLSGIFAIIMVLVLFLGACSTITVTGQWKDQKYKAGPLNKYIVIGLFKKMSARETIENTLADALKKSGVDAVSSLTVLTPDREINRNDKDLDNFFHLLGIDGVLIVKMTGMQKSEKYVGATTYYSAIPGVPFSGPYMSYYYNYYHSVAIPGYFEDYFSILLECSLFINTTNKLIWKAEARSKPYNQGSRELIIMDKTARDLSTVIIKTFKEDGFIKTAK